LQPKVPHQSAVAGVFSALEEIKKLALSRPAACGGLDRLRGAPIAVIAELDSTRPAAADLGNLYVDAGAGAIAVCAGPLGAEPDSAARISAHIQAPVLFLEPADTSYRLWQARACGADMVVLPAATLSDSALYSLLERAESLGMDAVVEVRGGADLVRALRARARAVLLRPTADAASAGASVHDLLLMVPDGVVKVAECGTARSGRTGLIACARNGADAVLVGAALLAGADSAAIVADLSAMGAHPALTARGSRAA
jgi:indole-3-glycerol phosphate synthase